MAISGGSLSQLMSQPMSQSMSQTVDSYTDLNALDKVKAMGRDKDPEALKQIAKQFESMFVSMLMKEMRSSVDVFAEDSLFNSSETRFHRDMYDQQLSLNLSAGKGIGLADALYRQMTEQYQSHMDVSKTKPDTDSMGALDRTQDTLTQGAFTQGALTTQGTLNVQPTKSLDNNTDQPDLSSMSPEEFLDTIAPYATQAAQALKVDPKVLLAQASLETGWGRYVIKGEADNSFNLFNIKADSRWSGDSIAVNTLEYRDGVAAKETAQFRRYDSIEESFNDYVDFIQNNQRYQSALEKSDDAKAYVDELQLAGYATDPKYAEKIERLMSDDKIGKALNRRDIL